MDLDSRGHSKLVKAWNNGCSNEYTRILEKLFLLADRHDHETPEMWYSRVRDLFRKLLEEHHSSRGGILSGNGYIERFGKLIERSDRVHGIPSNYIYCSQVKMTMAENTISYAPKFEPAYISPTKQETILPTSYQSLALNETISEIFISSQYAKQNNLLPSIDHLNQPALRLRDGTKITFI
ncbi:hypothetical protein C1646_814011 [Rhizophagus diaphanus]|nr:hypothetical protein C1646_814011 [Rhizophagus diaphanus] [Rhizophagus sp. MUCL 43196]